MLVYGLETLAVRPLACRPHTGTLLASHMGEPVTAAAQAALGASRPGLLVTTTATYIASANRLHQARIGDS